MCREHPPLSGQQHQAEGLLHCLACELRVIHGSVEREAPGRLSTVEGKELSGEPG